MTYKFLTFAALLIINTVCTANEPLVLDYAQFGPPQIAKEILGEYRYDWSDPDNHKPVKYNIKIVVASEPKMKQVLVQYKDEPVNKLDYRHLTYQEASIWLTEKIEYFEEDIATGDGDNLIMMFPTLQTLYKTKIILEEHF